MTWRDMAWHDLWQGLMWPKAGVMRCLTLPCTTFQVQVQAREDEVLVHGAGTGGGELAAHGTTMCLP